MAYLCSFQILANNNVPSSNNTNTIQAFDLRQQLLFVTGSQETDKGLGYIESGKYGNDDTYFAYLLNPYHHTDYTIVLENHFLDKIDFNIYEGDELLKSLSLSASKRNAKHHAHIRLNQNSILKLEFSIQNRPQYNMPVFLYKTEIFEERQLQEQLIYGLFFGAFILFLIYSTLTFFVTKQWIYLYLTGYIIFSNLFHIAEHGVWFPIEIGEKLLFISVFAGLAFLIQLSHNLLPTRKFQEFFDIGERVLYIYSIVMIALILSNIYDINITVFSIVYESLSIYGVCCYIFVFLRAVFFKTSPFLYRLLLVSYTSLVIGFLVKPFSFLGILDYANITKYSAMMGQVIELACLSGYFIIDGYLRILKSNRIKEEVRVLERSALQAQMNPHFIFNSLNSIQNFIMDNDKEMAMDYLSRFAKLIRQNLNASVEGRVSIAEEVSMLSNYLELEQLRHKDNFTFDIIVHNSIQQTNTFINPLLIQPFVENAILHGIGQETSESHIEIKLTKEGDFIKAIVADNGKGIEMNQVISKKKSMGMKITQKRLQHINDYEGEGYTITQGKQQKGTSVLIKIKTHGS